MYMLTSLCHQLFLCRTGIGTVQWIVTSRVTSQGTFNLLCSTEQEHQIVLFFKKDVFIYMYIYLTGRVSREINTQKERKTSYPLAHFADGCNFQGWRRPVPRTSRGFPLWVAGT